MKKIKQILVSILFIVNITVCQSCKSDDTPPSPVEICNDGIDNDNDGFVDCDDNDCVSDCLVEICNDGVDNDNDGFVDCDDNDCNSNPSC